MAKVTMSFPCLCNIQDPVLLAYLLWRLSLLAWWSKCLYWGSPLGKTLGGLLELRVAFSWKPTIIRKWILSTIWGSSRQVPACRLNVPLHSHRTSHLHCRWFSALESHIPLYTNGIALTWATDWPPGPGSVPLVPSSVDTGSVPPADQEQWGHFLTLVL